MRKHTRQAGFSAVIVLTIILVVVGIAFGAWRLAQKQPAADSTSTKSQAQKNPQTPAEQPKADKYLVIKEWGVRFELPEELRGDISYFMNTRAEESSGGPVLVSLTSKKFSAGNLKCSVIEGDEPRELLNLEMQIDGEGGETIDPAPFQRIDNARFYFAGSGCQEAIAREGSNEDRKLLSDLKNALIKNLEKN